MRSSDRTRGGGLRFLYAGHRSTGAVHTHDEDTGPVCGTGGGCGPSCGCTGCRAAARAEQKASGGIGARSSGDLPREDEPFDPTAETDDEYTPTMTRAQWARMSSEERQEYLRDLARNRREREEMGARLATRGFDALITYLRSRGRDSVVRAREGADPTIARIRRQASGERNLLDTLDGGGGSGGGGGGGGGAYRNTAASSTSSPLLWLAGLYAVSRLAK